MRITTKLLGFPLVTLATGSTAICSGGGQLVRVTNYDASGLMTHYRTFEYNESGLQSRVTEYDGSSRRTSYTTFEYNPSGLTSKQSCYDASGVLLGLTTYQWNEARLPSEISDHNGAGRLTGYTTYEYNASGLTTRVSQFDGSGSRTSYETYQYDASGLTTRMSFYSASGSLTSYYTYEYNASGLRTRTSFYSASGSLTSYITWEYNASGLMSKYSQYSGGHRTSCVTIEYNAFGQRTEESAWSESNQLLCFVVYEYNNVATVASPVFSPVSGSYMAAQSVTLSCATPAATIRYTTDGSEPTASSPVYTSAIVVSSSTTIKAKAFKDGWTASATATSSYVIVRPPSLQGQAMTREGFRLTLSGEVGARYQIFGATDLSEWVILSTVTNEFGTVQFTDGEGTSLPRRFYRAVWKP